MLRPARRTIFALALCGGVASAALAQAGELIFGVAPYLSPSRMIEQYTPLKDYLANAVGRSMLLTTAPDFNAFVERTQNGEYDVIFTAPHMGRLAQKRDGMRVVAQTGHHVTVAVVTRRNSGIGSLDDMRGHTMAIGSRTSMVYQIVDAALRQRNIVQGRDVRVVDTPSFSNVLLTVARGEADAGTTGAAMWETAPAEQKRDLVEIFRSPPHPGFFILVHPRLGQAAIDRLQAAMLRFKDTPAGATFFKRSQMVDFRKVDEAALRSVDAFGEVFIRGN